MMICIVSSSAAVSGAEVVLKDYLKNSKEEFILLLPDVRKVQEFFHGIPSVKEIVTLPGYMTQGKNKILSRIHNVNVVRKEAIFISKLLKNEKYKNIDIVYGSNVISCLSLGICRKKVSNKRYILHIHDMMSFCSYTPLVKLLCRNMETITVSEKCKQELVSITNFKPEDITVVYNGIDNTFSPKNKELLIKSDIVIGYAGNIIERKGCIYLAEAFKKINSIYPSVQLKMSYHLKDDKYYSKVVEELDNCNVKWEQNTREQMKDFYHSIDILVVPSLKDPLPTTVLEAMACGDIVIGSNVDGIPEMLEEEYLFEPESADAIYNLLNTIIGSISKYRQICYQKNIKTIEQIFSQKEKIEKMDRIFRKG